MRIRRLRHWAQATLFVASILAAAPYAAADVPQTITNQGRLFGADGTPIDGSMDVVFAIYDAADATAPIWTETHSVTFEAGYYSVSLGSIEPFGDKVFDGSLRYFGITIGSDPELLPRSPVQSVPYALLAQDVNGDIHPTTVSIGGTEVINNMGEWVGPPTGLAGPTGATGATGAAGPTGADGTVGPAGPTGADGLAGPTGADGLPGATGATGAIGPMGPIGLQGDPGVAGATGATGATGTQGITGPMGPMGLQGLAGPTGATGVAGATGAQGDTGAMGPAGPIGPQGPIGATGAQGDIGPMGPIGATGAQGDIGPTGAMGAQGPQGNVGPTGPQGTAGNTGAQGPQGNVGPTGPQGTAGNTGAQGPQGNVGPTGPQGTAGNTGAQGPQGNVGPTGPQGTAGNTGAQGPQGNVGPTGPQGTAGNTGAQGPQGNVGAQGPQGNVGAQGPQGNVGAQGPQGNVGPIGPAGSANINGTTNFIIKFTSATTGGNSLLFDNGTSVGLGTTAPTSTLHVVSAIAGPGTRAENTNANGVAISGTNVAAAGAGTGHGVVGITSQASGFGTASFNGNATGTAVFGYGNGLATGNFLTAGSGGAFTGLTTGLYAKVTSLGTAQAIYTDNAGVIVLVNYWNATQYKIIGTGTVSTIVKDPTDSTGQRSVVLHAPETPEIYFEDYGEARLEQGYAHVELDPILMANVVVSDKHPLRVFVQLEDNEFTRGVVVKNKTDHGFDVVELDGGASDMPFQWHIVCNRADEVFPNGRISRNADTRFETAPVPLETETNALSTDKSPRTGLLAPKPASTDPSLTWLHTLLPGFRSSP